MSEIMHGTLKSRTDGLEIAVMAVVPKRPYRGIFQIVHGMSEYKERYLPFMQFLAEEGYLAVIHDHRGHGGSVRDQKDLGYMYGGGADALLDDILQVNEILKKRFPQAPLVLFGHSMGSLAVRAFTRKYGDKGHMEALYICGSPSENKARFIGEFMAQKAKEKYGDRHVCSRIEQLSFGRFAKRFPGEESPSCWICSDKQVVADYDASPLCGFTFTADAYLVLFDLMKQAYARDGWQVYDERLPVYFISGRDDPCIGSCNKFHRAIHAMRLAGYVNCGGTLYPEMRHEILNEAGKEKVYRDIADRLEKYFPSRWI